MKSIFRSLIFLCAFTLTACMGSTDIPEIKGKIVNHTKLANEMFKVGVSYRCKTPSIVAPGNSCGNQGAEVNVTADGSFRIPAMTLPAGVGYEYRYDFTVTANDPNDTNRFKQYGGWSFNDGAIEDNLPKVTNVSVYEIAEQDLSYVLASGQSSEAWATGNGRDSGLDFFFQLPDPSPWTNTLRLTGYFGYDIRRMQKHYVFVAGSHPANFAVPVSVKLRNGYLDKEPLYAADTLMDLSRPLPRNLSEFRINDSRHPQLVRSVNGEWKSVLNFHENYQTESEHNMFDGRFDLRCTNGVLTGTVALESRPANKKQFKGTLPVAGTCTGESGNIQFSFAYATNHPETSITVRYERIGGNSTSLLGPSGRLDFTNQLFSLNLSMTDNSGKVLGNATVDRK